MPITLARDKVMRRFHSRILIYLNMSLTSRYSKRQNTVESSTFGYEYFATRIAVNKVKSMRYKVRMVGVPLDDSSNVFTNNESVVNASMNPESTLNKKHVSITYHLTRETFAAKMLTSISYFLQKKI